MPLVGEHALTRLPLLQEAVNKVLLLLHDRGESLVRPDLLQPPLTGWGWRGPGHRRVLSEKSSAHVLHDEPRGEGGEGGPGLLSGDSAGTPDWDHHVREPDPRLSVSVQVQVLETLQVLGGRLEVVTHTHRQAVQVRGAVAGWEVAHLLLSLHLLRDTNPFEVPPAHQDQQDGDQDGELDDDEVRGVDGLSVVLVVPLIGEDCVQQTQVKTLSSVRPEH